MGFKKSFSEVYKVMKAGGTFVVINESDGNDATALKYEQIIEGE
mgnify:CR=1 FL=1